LGIGPNPQSPIPNPQSPIPNPHIYNKSKLFRIIKIKINEYKNKNNLIYLKNA